MRRVAVTDETGANELAVSWLHWAKRLQTMSQTGLTYSRDSYDVARYHEITAIAIEMMAKVGGVSSQRVQDVFSNEIGHATPKLDVRAAVFQAVDSVPQVLLVRERRDARWTLPGGWVDVGESASEAAARETAEESGYEVRVTRLLAAWDMGKHPHPPQPYFVCKLVFEAEIVGVLQAGGDGQETDGVAFFPRSGLPPLSLERILPDQIDSLFELHALGMNSASLFD